MRITQLSTRKNSHNLWFAGQSNCNGLNGISPDTASYPALSGRHIFNPFSQAWEKLQQNYNNSGAPLGFTGYVGIEIKLMQLLYDYYGTDQYMMKYAQGGVALATDAGTIYNWSPDSTDDYMFKGFVSSYFAAKNSFPAVWIPPKILIWWQGESDTGLADSIAYRSNFNYFMSNLKNQCNLPNLKVVQVLLSNNQTGYDSTGRTNINNAKVAFAINGNKVVNTDGASVQVGGAHFTTAGYLDIAQRIFNLIITML